MADGRVTQIRIYGCHELLNVFERHFAVAVLVLFFVVLPLVVFVGWKLMGSPE